MNNRILSLAQGLQQDLLRIRQHLHANPELSFKEYQTSAFIQQELRALGIEFEKIADTGLIGTIQGRSTHGPVIGLRADMDALPITELNAVPYASTNPGVMHACGHDVHTTWLLGAARLLIDLRNEWEGTVRLFFQPGEEVDPGGANIMIQQGALEKFRPDKMFGLHVAPQFEIGKIGIGAGPVMASVDDIFITLRGPGGHAAAPHETIDTVLAAAELVTGLQKIISRNKPPFSPSILSICSFHGGDATNIIPATVTLSGTLRCMDEVWRAKAIKLIHSFVEAISQGSGAEIECRIDTGYPSLLNDPVATEYARERLQQIFSPDSIIPMPQSLGAEDFAYFAQQVPASFLRIGTGNSAKGITSAIHTPRFDIDESALPIGVAVLTALVVNPS